MAEPARIVNSVCGMYRAEIVPLPTGGFAVTVFQWREEIVPGHGKVAEFWERASRSVMFAGTPVRAAELVEEEFRNLGTSSARATNANGTSAEVE